MTTVRLLDHTADRWQWYISYISYIRYSKALRLASLFKISLGFTDCESHKSVYPEAFSLKEHSNVLEMVAFCSFANCQFYLELENCFSVLQHSKWTKIIFERTKFAIHRFEIRDCYRFTERRSNRTSQIESLIDRQSEIEKKQNNLRASKI